MLTPGQERLLRHLSRDVRLASAEQATALLAGRGDSPRDAVRELSRMVTRDLLRRDRVIARILPGLTAPLATWSTGAAPPEMAAVAWQTQKRWDVTPRVVTVYRAGPAARRLFGLSTAGGPGNLNALSHDIACCEMLLAFARDTPTRVPDWVGEDLRKPDQEHGEKLPDVILYDEDRNPYLVCEVAGVYPKARLDAFHDYVANVVGLPYELW